MHRRARIGLGTVLLLTGTLAGSSCGLPGLEGTVRPPARPAVWLRVDSFSDTAVVTNRDDVDLDLTGWRLQCEARWFNFPSITLEPGGTVTVTNGGSGRHDPPRYLRWRPPNIWSWPYPDRDLELRDASWNVVARSPIERLPSSSSVDPIERFYVR